MQFMQDLQMSPHRAGRRCMESSALFSRVSPPSEGLNLGRSNCRPTRLVHDLVSSKQQDRHKHHFNSPAAQSSVTSSPGCRIFVLQQSRRQNHLQDLISQRILVQSLAAWLPRSSRSQVPRPILNQTLTAEKDLLAPYQTRTSTRMLGI